MVEEEQAKQIAKKPEIGVKSNAGRPTLYRPEYAEQAYKFCLLGCTDERMAELFDVSVSSIYEWKKNNPEFCEATKNGKEIADSNVANSLYHRATGCSHPDTHVCVINDEVVTTEITKHYPPDTAAAFIWLKNRAPQRWRDKVEIEQKTEVTMVSNTDLDHLYTQKLLARRDGEAQHEDGKRILQQDFDGAD